MTLPIRLCLLILLIITAVPASSQILNKQALLNRETFWDNRDWDWYKANIPFFDCPDAAINTTYYYRWELVTKHLVYGSPESGYAFTEFIDRPFWSGAYGAISCPTGHQLNEVRWLRDPRYARDYARYWFRTPGAQPRNYSTWLADAIWSLHEVHPDNAFITGLLPDMVKNYQGWEESHFVPGVGLFWQTGHDDGMEYNINSRQSQDIVRGAPGFRPTLNAYLWADAMAISRTAELAGRIAEAELYRKKAAGLKEKMQKLLWDPERRFFYHMYRDDERDKEGNVVKAGSLTYQTGKYAGSAEGRELIGYVPWQFNMVDPGYESAWKKLIDPNTFFSEYGPTTLGRSDPMFYLSKTCCWWSGMSWPYASSQTLKAMANLLQNYRQNEVTRADYFKIFQAYTRTQRKNGQPYIAEAANPFTGSWEGHDSPGHSNHYFHSSYNDLVITGLVGVRPRAGNSVEVEPLAPETWDYFALEDLAYHGHRLTVLWDRDGKRYGRGAGLQILVDGKLAASSPKLARLKANVPAPKPVKETSTRRNYVVNNDGLPFPMLTASYSSSRAPIASAQDGNYWYHQSPPNRWTTEGSPNAADWVEADYGVKRSIDTVKLYLLDDEGMGSSVKAPAYYRLEWWTGREWKPIPGQKRVPAVPTGHRANTVTFPPLTTEKLRVLFTNAPGGRMGLTEIEAWGTATGPYVPPPLPLPMGNLVYNGTDMGSFAAASFTSKYGDSPGQAIDGKIVYRATPHNRWTAYESPNPTDWLEIHLNRPSGPPEVGRVVLHIYDDGGGVQAPAAYNIQFWDGAEWADARNQQKSPAVPVGGVPNTVTFTPVKTSRIRIVFTHRGASRSGVTEVSAWAK